DWSSDVCSSDLRNCETTAPRRATAEWREGELPIPSSSQETSWRNNLSRERHHVHTTCGVGFLRDFISADSFRSSARPAAFKCFRMRPRFHSSIDSGCGSHLDRL